MNFSDQDIFDRVIKGDQRAVARLISLSENRIPRAEQIQANLFKHAGQAHVLGVTGSPGAGKSTLVDVLAAEWHKQGKKVAIIAVDPTSPFSGGAILGDRIRMNRSLESAGIYVRSMATRGSLGGISRATIDAVQILDAAGFDLIIIETVGVGQAEVDIVRIANSCVVVLVPGMGDSVQAFKAGILEIADVFVINKADREGADLVDRDLRVLLSLTEEKAGSWKPLVMQTVATNATGIDAVVQAIDQHSTWLKQSVFGQDRKIKVLEHTIQQIVQDMILDRALRQQGTLIRELAQQCANKITNPYEAAKKLIQN